MATQRRKSSVQKRRSSMKRKYMKSRKLRGGLFGIFGKKAGNDDAAEPEPKEEKEGIMGMVGEFMGNDEGKEFKKPPLVREDATISRDGVDGSAPEGEVVAEGDGEGEEVEGGKKKKRKGTKKKKKGSKKRKTAKKAKKSKKKKGKK